MKLTLTSFAKLLVQRPKTILFVFTVITLLVGSQAFNLYMEADFTTFLPKNDITLKGWEELNDEFQIGSTILVYIVADDIRDPNVLKEIDRVSSSEKINKWSQDDGELDGVFSVKSITSLIKTENAKSAPLEPFGGTRNNAIPEDYHYPGLTGRDLVSKYIARDSVQNMKGTLFTNKYDIAIIIIQLAKGADYDDVLARTKEAIKFRGTEFTEMTITGTIAMQQEIQKSSMDKLKWIFPIAVIAVSIVLFFFHRNFKSIIIAFLPPAFSLTLTFGVLGIVWPELTIISVASVALLMGLGVDYSIHLMNRFAEENNLDDNLKRTEKTLRSTGKAVLLSTVTTMIGFGSLMISSMSPMVAFGFACSLGILFCFISSIIIVPCLSLLLKFEKPSSFSGWIKFANFVLDNKKRIIVLAIFFAVMSLIVLPQVKTDVNYLSMAPEGIPAVEAMQKYSDNFGGGANFNAFMITTDPGALKESEVIDAIYDMQLEMQDQGVYTYSIANEYKNINDLIQRNDFVYKICDLADVNSILLDAIVEEGLISEDYSKTLVFVYIPVGMSIKEMQELIDNINSITEATTLPYNGRASYLTGQDAVNVAINQKLKDEQTRSMIIALLLVLAALIFIFKSSIYGLLTMVPIGFVLVWEPGFLVAFDIPLSVVTISIASIMIGIGIDYGVHITQRVKEGINDGLPKDDATKIAIEKTGLSLVEAAITTIAGIASIFFIGIPALQDFGLVVIVMTAFSCVAAALILPISYGLKYVK